MNFRGTPFVLRLLGALLLVLSQGFAGAADAETRESASGDETAVRALLARSILAEGEEQDRLLTELADTGSPLIAEVLAAWRQGGVWIAEEDGARIPFVRDGREGPGVRVDNGRSIDAPEATVADTTSKIRRGIKNTLDFLAMADPSPAVRVSAINKMGMLQNAEYLPVFQKRLETEKDKKVREALETAIAVTQLNDESADTRVAAIEKLAELKAIGALDLLKAIATAEPEPSGEDEEPADGSAEVEEAAEDEGEESVEEVEADGEEEDEEAGAEEAAGDEEETAAVDEEPAEENGESVEISGEEEATVETEEDGALEAVEEAGGEEAEESAEEVEEMGAEEETEEDAAAAQFAAGEARVKAAAVKAVAEIEQYLKYVEVAGAAFRGLSAGSVLLVVALGLAITFGLMGVINMAHGEIMAVGAYTTYVTQNIFASGLSLTFFGLGVNIPGLNLTGAAADSYFLWSLPAAFCAAALTGIALERGVIRFLYRRPLESLLATWGISLILQQMFRLIFGANNVQVSSPAWLSGNFTVSDVTLGWNRLFVIGFAVFIVIGTWLLLTRTRLGLLIRAVMQNRQMAACMGVRTERVNMITFGLGSGLAGLAGAFLSQIANVGPSLGKNYIVDSFMTVVTGGLGNLAGTVLSALGIGVADQALQSLLDPVMGKVYVLVALILFLLWKPGGLFPTRGRGLD